MRYCVLRWTWAVLLAAVVTSPAAAEDFRIETKIFVADQEAPASENLTLFSGGTVYDFLADPQEIAIYKPSAQDESGRIVLLDPARQVRAELTTAEILEFSEKLKRWASMQEDALVKFASDPHFEQEFDARTGELAMTSAVLSYRLITEEAESDEAARQYREFSDWYARLGPMVHAGPAPPFPRLLVNQTLYKLRRLPREVHLSIPQRRPSDLRSRHRIQWRLSKADGDRIEQANEDLVNFRRVDLEEYRNR